MRLAPPSADHIREKRAKDWEKTNAILVGREKSLERMLLHYVHGGGAQADHVIKLLRAKIDDAALQQHITQSGESVFDRYGRILPPCLKQFCPTHADVFFDVGPQESVQVYELFPASRNEHHTLSPPLPISKVLHRQQRPAFRAYSILGAALYASSAGYQVFDERENCFWPSASSRTFSKVVTSVPVLRTADHLVIIQDRFPGENFAHFLFDWIPRIGIFIESNLEPTAECTFVMGVYQMNFDHWCYEQ